MSDTDDINEEVSSAEVSDNEDDDNQDIQPFEQLIETITNSTSITDENKNMLMSVVLDGNIESIIEFLNNINGISNNHNNQHEKVSMEELLKEQKEYNTKYCNEIYEENDVMVYTFGVSESSKIEKCSICLEDIPCYSKIIRTSCDHIFCPECFYKWYAKEPSCPCCRKKMHLQ